MRLSPLVLGAVQVSLRLSQVSGVRSSPLVLAAALVPSQVTQVSEAQLFQA